MPGLLDVCEALNKPGPVQETRSLPVAYCRKSCRSQTGSVPSLGRTRSRMRGCVRMCVLIASVLVLQLSIT